MWREIQARHNLIRESRFFCQIGTVKQKEWNWVDHILQVMSFLLQLGMTTETLVRPLMGLSGFSLQARKDVVLFCPGVDLNGFVWTFVDISYKATVKTTSFPKSCTTHSHPKHNTFGMENTQKILLVCTLCNTHMCTVNCKLCPGW